MPSFVEEAVLRVRDADATKNIGKINRALRELQRSANALKNVKVNLGVSDRAKPPPMSASFQRNWHVSAPRSVRSTSASTRRA